MRMQTTVITTPIRVSGSNFFFVKVVMLFHHPPRSRCIPRFGVHLLKLHLHPHPHNSPFPCWYRCMRGMIPSWRSGLRKGSRFRGGTHRRRRQRLLLVGVSRSAGMACMRIRVLNLVLVVVMMMRGCISRMLSLAKARLR